jgi:KDO2-lipid IV(A) lauroyltransferase
VTEIPFDPAAADREAEAIRLTAACSLVLESAIRRSPEEWVWMHERWKTRPPTEVTESQQASRMPKTAELSDA